MAASRPCWNGLQRAPMTAAGVLLLRPRPARVAMAHSLVGFYGMLGDMRRFRDLIPESYVNDAALRQKGEDDHGIGLLSGDDDCPAFDRLWKYCRAYAGG
uniref:Uncharacterized protein n=1 Tax=Oryza barthii TaxID=65489 RepID=A0A0D3FKE4_9ORYZ